MPYIQGLTSVYIKNSLILFSSQTNALYATRQFVPDKTPSSVKDVKNGNIGHVILVIKKVFFT